MRTRQQARLRNGPSDYSDLNGGELHSPPGAAPDQLVVDPGSVSDEPRRSIPVLESPPSSASHKRSRTATEKKYMNQSIATRVSKKGRLEGILFLPMEVFTEITGYLSPADVIALCRSNKLFRGILLNRSAAQIWIRALGNVPGLPPCPVDLCEPQYAALIYSKRCSICAASVVKPMEPHLNARLCNVCRRKHLINVYDVPEGTLRSLIRGFLEEIESPISYLRSDVQKLRDSHSRVLAWGDRDLEAAWILEQTLLFSNRCNYVEQLTAFLRSSNDDRVKELETLKAQRRKDLKERLRDAGWEESDWSFPWQDAREWAALTEGLKVLTDRSWKNLYPKLVPLLETNREVQNDRFRSERRRRRKRCMHSLLVKIKNQNIILQVPEATIQGKYSGTSSNVPATSLYTSMIQLERPLPPPVDAWNLPIISDLLEKDIIAEELQEELERSQEDIENVLIGWGLSVERELVDILKSGPTSDHEELAGNDSQLVPLDLQFELPSQYADFLSTLTPEARLLLRADSVFRFTNKNPSPPPLFYPECFSIVQARTESYIDPARSDGEDHKAGWHWNTGDVGRYPEGLAAAVALLKEIGRPHAAQCELQALGPRFVCGLCSDEWLRTWNEIVHHYAEALVHERLFDESQSPKKPSITYNKIHSIDPASRIKGQEKPLIVFHTNQEAEKIMRQEKWHQSLYQCEVCTDLGIVFQTTNLYLAKHIEAVHGREPSKVNLKSIRRIRKHTFVDPSTEFYVSDSSSEKEELDGETLQRRARKLGTALYWFDPALAHVDPDDKEIEEIEELGLLYESD